VQEHRKKVAETGFAPKVGKKGQASSSKMAHLDEMEPKFVFKKSEQHQQGGCIRGWATREAAADMDGRQVFFPYPEV